jgi:hypothetical protein
LLDMWLKNSGNSRNGIGARAFGTPNSCETEWHPS